MSKLFPIILSLLMFFQSINIHVEDALKLNEVIEHLQLHKDRYGDSIFTFISKHYGSLKKSHKKQHKKEQKEHPHPPIHHNCIDQFTTSFLLLTFSYSLEYSQELEKTINSDYQDKFSTFEKQHVFQPPKVT